MQFLVVGLVIGCLLFLGFKNSVGSQHQLARWTGEEFAQRVFQTLRNNTSQAPVAYNATEHDQPQESSNATESHQPQDRLPRILCWVPSRTAQGPLIDRILATYANSCDYFLFSSTEANEKNHVVKIDFPTNQNLWNIIHPVWNYVEEKYGDSFDWFVKLDDDTYFSGDNFKHLVKDFNPNEPYYLGHTAYEVMKPVDDPRAPFNLGAGHAISRGSLRRLAPFLPDSKKPLPEGAKEKCGRWNSWAEDVMLGQCLWLAGIGKPSESKDSWGRENFLAFAPEDNLITVRRPDSTSWFWRGKPKSTGSGARCCSSRPILWHGLKGSRTAWFYWLNYFMYNVSVDPITS